MHVRARARACMCVLYYVHLNAYVWRPEEDVRSPGAGVIGGCELAGMGTQNSRALHHGTVLAV